MSGVVYRPPAVHECAPGWEVEPNPPGSGIPGTHLAVPPSPSEFPRGTVWECECGTRWISRGLVGGRRSPLGGYAAAALEWEREGWFARWRRRRKERSDA